MRFTKMHGAGNDYVFVETFTQEVPAPEELARRISDRHYGVGADGLVLLCPSRTADVGMRMFNVDGSEAEMCGNAIRCLAKLAWDRRIARTNPMRIETAAGVRSIDLIFEADEVTAARVDMGEPRLRPNDIPVTVPGEGPVVDRPFLLEGNVHAGTCVSMGNPHLVLFVADLDEVPLAEVGPKWERHPDFPRRVNVHFVRVRGRQEIAMRTWERGSGATLACGTGASAVCVAGVLTGRTDRRVLAHLPGGDLRLEWDETTNHVFMTGPAVEVFTGDWPLPRASGNPGPV